MEDIANQGESGVTQHDGANAHADGSPDGNFETGIAQQMSATAGGYTIAAFWRAPSTLATDGQDWPPGRPRSDHRWPKSTFKNAPRSTEQIVNA